MHHTATEYLRALSEVIQSIQVTDRRQDVLLLDEGTEKAIEMILSVASASRKVMLAGNGGSAAIASHMQNDLCKGANIRTLVFTEPPLLTALANDHGYGCVFERPVQLWADPGDLMLTISSSGASENILRAVRASIQRGCPVITFSGFSSDNPLRQMGDINFYVRSDSYGHVETAHAALAHFISDQAGNVINMRSKTGVGV